MLKGYIEADYSPENWTMLLDIKSAADMDIDNAASVADVMTALNDAEAAMAAVHTLLDDAKASAHASLNAALAGYSQGDYSPENWAILLNAMTTGETDNATTVADVSTALTNAEAAMAAVHTLLTDGKIAAHTSLEATLAAYTEADYTPEDWKALNSNKSAGDAVIDEAADLAQLEAAQLAAVAAMAGVQTIAQALTEAKSAAHNALEAALIAYSEGDYTGDDWTALNGFKTAGDASIDEAADLAQVEAAQTAAVAAMDGVPTIAQTLATAKSAAHDALAEALTAYAEGDYTGDDWTALNGFRTDGDTAIDEAAELAQVDAAHSAAAVAMAGVQTIAQALAAAKSAAHDALAAALGHYESSDHVDSETAVTESKEIGDAVTDAATVIETSEEPATTDLTVSSAEAEVADANTAEDTVAASREVPATTDSTPDAAEEKPSDLEPALEIITPDIE